ncbi:mCG1040477, partial [Mus musculus]
ATPGVGSAFLHLLPSGLAMPGHKHELWVYRSQALLARGRRLAACESRSTLLENPFALGTQPSLFPGEAYEPVTKPVPRKGGSAVGLKGYMAPAPS